MRSPTLLVLLAAALCLGRPVHAASAGRAATPVPLLLDHDQLLLVRSASWGATTGELTRYERQGETRDWVRFGDVIPVNLGRHGMAWGQGLHASPDEGPVKREGDGRSPAGVFALGTAFGSAERLPEGARGFPYLQALDTTYCVEDQRSEYYNQIIDRRAVAPTTWQKWSPLRRRDGLFDWALVVAHNADGVRPGAGSCVFLHVWRARGVPTAGCTAMPAAQIQAVLTWLDAKAAPILVQLPEGPFQELRTAWDLPS